MTMTIMMMTTTTTTATALRLLKTRIRTATGTATASPTTTRIVTSGLRQVCTVPGQASPPTATKKRGKELQRLHATATNSRSFSSSSSSSSSSPNEWRKRQLEHLENKFRPNDANDTKIDSNDEKLTTTHVLLRLRLRTRLRLRPPQQIQVHPPQ